MCQIFLINVVRFFRNPQCYIGAGRCFVGKTIDNGLGFILQFRLICHLHFNGVDARGHVGEIRLRLVDGKRTCFHHFSRCVGKCVGAHRLTVGIVGGMKFHRECGFGADFV